MNSLNLVAFGSIAQTCVLSVINLNNNRMQELDAEEDRDRAQMILLNSLLAAGHYRERTVWKHPSSSDWWDNIYPSMNDRLFISHFRVDRRTFDWILNEIRGELTTKDTVFRDAVSAERKLAVSLKCLATTCDLLTVSSLFGIGRSSAHKYFLQFINCMYKKIVPKIIKFPKPDAIAAIEREFEGLWGFPMAVAAIDGTHIPFNPPTSLSSDFHNYKGWSSIMAIAMCDARGKAMWLKCGMPGRMSDSGAFKTTSCYAKLAAGDILPSVTKRINNVEVPYLVLGDSGFAMEPWLSKPFTHHGLVTEKQKLFNYRHSRARRTVENMFGRVKLRWRRLLRGLDVKYENAHKVISVAFALHNICETRCIDQPIIPEELADNQAFERRFPQPESVIIGDMSSGVVTRNALMEYFSNQENPWTG